MTGEFYVDSFDSLPFGKTVDLFSNQLPRWSAFVLAAWYRLRYWLGCPPKPEYATRWCDTFVSQPREDLPARALSRWAPYIEELRDLGFTEIAWSNSDTIGAKAEALIILLDETGTTLVLLLWMRMSSKGGYLEEQTSISLVSYYPDGRELMTGAIPRAQLTLVDTLTPDYVDARFLGIPIAIANLIQQHTERQEQNDILQFTPEGILAHYQKQVLRFFKHECEAGFLRPLSPHEVEYAKGCRLL
ncbi:MAG: hypothetical protein ACI8P0_004041 [Planctomycetaceae bacterium]|jgi:hypothetical protein